MNIYRYDPETLEYVPIDRKKIKVFRLACILFSIAVITYSIADKKKPPPTEQEVMIILAKKDRFTEKKFIKMVKGMNLRFPHIVHAQAYLESGGFNSPLFNENNNLFGMRNPSVRVNVSRGERKGYSYYNSWQESLYDYGLYNASYLWRIVDEEAYFDYLAQNYASDKDYVQKLKRIIEQNKSKFR